MQADIPRDRLVDFVLACPEPLIVCEAAAGMGKSTLLRQLSARTGMPVHVGKTAPDPHPSGKAVLWDIAPGLTPTEVPEAFVEGRARIIVAKRPELELEGLTRASAYGRCRRLGADDLLLTASELAGRFGSAEATRIVAQTGGWPMLLAYWGAPGDSDSLMRQFLADEVLRPMDPAALVDLEALLSAPAKQSAQRRNGPDGEQSTLFAVEAIRQPLSEALRRVMSARLGIPAEAKSIAEAYGRRGRIAEAILTYQRGGHLDLALETLIAAQGVFFIYLHGPEAFDRVLAGFPSSFAMRSETVVMCLALQALKRGDISLARRLLLDRFGESANDPEAVFSPRSEFSRDFRAFRLVMLIYEDVFFTDELLEKVFAVLPLFPIDVHLLRGSFYNSVLEFYMRRRRFAEAAELAQRARYHYEQAQAPMLSFYVSLHEAIMRLLMADAVTARRHAAEAAHCLRRVAFDSPNDARLLSLLDACVEYEGGASEPLARFLSLELDDFAQGEIWPSLIEFALQYGSQVLSEHYSTIAARSFLDRWRIYQIRNRQFRLVIELREAAVLQNGNRWQEAAEKLADIDSPVTRSFVLAAGEELSRLADRDEISLAAIWLKQLVHEMPTRPGMEAQLSSMLANLLLTERQRMGVEIWLAFCFKRRRDLSKARALLQATFEKAARLGALAPLTEERIFLAELIGHRSISEFLDASGTVRQVLRRLRESALPGFASSSGLSRRETKVLLMISEGATNKSAANALGLSVATVKFHLGNVYRKLGCTKRREAISAARSLGIMR